MDPLHTLPHAARVVPLGHHRVGDEMERRCHSAARAHAGRDGQPITRPTSKSRAGSERPAPLATMDSVRHPEKQPWKMLLVADVYVTVPFMSRTPA